MAIQTPLHVKGLRLPREWHLIDPSVTGFATDSLMDMDTVVEIDEVRRVVDAYPFKRPIVAKAGANRFERRAIGPNLFVAVHAHFGRRNSRKRRYLDLGVAVPAVDPQT